MGREAAGDRGPVGAMKRRNGRGAKGARNGDDVTDGRAEQRPGAVPSRATHDGETQGRWPWVEPSVWTARMLTALEEGVKGGQWYSLIDKVWNLDNLRAATDKVVGNAGAPGVDGQTTAQFDAQRDEQLRRVQSGLRDGSYRPSPLRPQKIPKPGTNKHRVLSIPTVRDRIVQTALRHVLEPIFEARFLACSYGFRPGRSAQQALDAVEEGLKEGKVWVVDADIEDFFGTISTDLVRAELAEQIRDGRVLDLVDYFMAHAGMAARQTWQPTQGIAQGAPLSPLLAKVHLHPVDTSLVAQGLAVVRYADDLVVLCTAEAEAQQALELLRQTLAARGLRLHPDKTRVVNATVEGFDFLGYHYGPNPRSPKNEIRRRPRDKSLRSFKDRVRGLTRRLSGVALETTIQHLSPVLRGWWNYFRRSEAWVMKELDGWIRRRLRAIVLAHEGRRDRSAHGTINQRVPNAELTRLGLFSLSGALARVR
jgi:RNA-directed DNA polymerase